MKSCLRLFLVLSGWLLLGNPAARASHALGGQLTYEYVGTAAQPNRYRVTCRFFRDCSGIDAPASLTLNCRVGTPSTACNSNDSRNFTATLTRGILTIGAPYCNSADNTCSTTGRPNYQTARYEAVVTLPPTAAWTLSVTENARPTLANVTPAAGGDLYLEATLNNQLTLAGGTTQNINNTSAQYLEQNVSIPFVCYQQRTTLSFAAVEPDGDSLVYKLDRTLEGCNQPMTYKSMTIATPLPGNPPCVVAFPPNTTYSTSFPIPSFSITGACPVQTAVPSFTFNPATGSATFTPFLYDATTPANNKYSVVGQVTEYRKINGRYYQVGSVRRDLIVIVTDCGGNQVPNLPSVAGTPTDSLVVECPLLSSVTTSFTLSDPNPSDLLTVAFNTPTDPLYPGMYTNPSAPNTPVSVVSNGTSAPVLQVRLRPDFDVLGRTYRIPVQVVDNACPLRGTQNFVLVLRCVPARPTATHTARARAVLSAYPNPFAEQVRFTLPRPQGAQAQVLVTDALGRLVARLPVPAGPGPEATLTWTPAPTLPAGVYLARPATGGPAIRLLRTLR